MRPRNAEAERAGESLAVSEYPELYQLLGNTYGGDKDNFALPDLQGRVPLHQGNGFTLGQVTGEYNHTLDMSELAAHSHPMNVAATGPYLGSNGLFPGDNRPSEAKVAPLPGTPIQIWGTGPNNLTFSPTAISPAGGSHSHNNQQPYLTINFCIAVTGLPATP